MIFSTVSARPRAAQASYLVLGALLAATAAPALAQDAAAPEGSAAASDDAIVVTGFRASLESSIRTKRNDLAIVESVSAEDIGKLPDVSIAESIARLPGLTAQRQDGRDQVISIRGLGPEFSTALLNGRQQVTTGDNRGVEFDQYPSELLSAVKVYKTASADLIGQGLAGTVDLQTIRPLSLTKRILSVSGRYERNEYKALNPDSQRDGYRASFTYADKFADDTLGIVIGLAATSAPTQNKRFNAWGYPTFDFNNDTFGIRDDKGTPGDTKDDTFTVRPAYAGYVGAKVIGGAKPYIQSNTLRRYGAVGTVQWEPSDAFSTAVDVFYSKFTEKQRLRGIEFPLYWSSAVLQPGGTVEDGLIVNPTYTGVFGVQRNDYNKRKAKTISLGWNGKYEINDGLRLSADVAYSRAKRTDFLLESYTGTGNRKSGAPDTVTATRQPNGNFTFDTLLDYSDPAQFVLTDPQGWGGNAVQTGDPLVQAGFLNRPSFTDELKQARLDLTVDLGATSFKSLSLGIAYSDRQKESRFKSYFLRLPNGATSLPVPGEANPGTISLGFLGIDKAIAYNPLYLYRNVYDAQEDIRPITVVRDYGVEEKVWTGYAQLNIDDEVGGRPLRGNVGVQLIHTKQSSDGSQAFIVFNPDNSQSVQIVPQSGSSSYTYALPSIN
jgi:iron complex outermembrane receptor protein